VLQALPIDPSNWYLLSDDVNSLGVKSEMNMRFWFVYSVKSIVLFHCFISDINDVILICVYASISKHMN